MTSQPGYQTFTMQILPNMSGNKGLQTMKFVQLIEHNGRNNFFQKPCRKTSSRSLSVF